MAQRAGWEAQCRFKSQGSATVHTFAFRRLRVNGQIQPLDVSNSEGKPGRVGAANARGYVSNVKNLRSARVTMEQATFDDTDNPFAAPYLLIEGNYIDELIVYPAGVSNPASARTFAGLLITSADHNMQVGQDQPVTIEAVSDGQYN